MADQTCTVTYEHGSNYEGRVTKVIWDWSSATGGAVVAAGAEGVGTTTTHKFTGYVASFHTKPDGGATVPSSYTITLYDDDGRPLATKSSASTTAVENHSSGQAILDTPLNIVISGAGDAKGGTAWAYLYTKGK